MRQSKLIYPKIFIFLLPIIIGCTKEKREPTAPLVNNSGPATLSTLQTDVIRLSCGTSGCHDNRANPASNLDLSSFDKSYANLVNKKSLQATNMKLVEPGFPDKSYLVYKLQGTHATVGGTGVRMPQYAASINSGDFERIVNWITDGAQRN